MNEWMNHFTHLERQCWSGWRYSPPWGFIWMIECIHSLFLSSFFVSFSTFFFLTDKKATVYAAFAIRLSIHANWFEFVMNAIMGVMKDDVLFVVILALQMLIIVGNVSSWKRIATDAPKLSISEPPRRIYSMNAKNMVSKKDDPHTHHNSPLFIFVAAVGTLVRVRYIYGKSMSLHLYTGSRVLFFSTFCCPFFDLVSMTARPTLAKYSAFTYSSLSTLVFFFFFFWNRRKLKSTVHYCNIDRNVVIGTPEESCDWIPTWKRIHAWFSGSRPIFCTIMGQAENKWNSGAVSWKRLTVLGWISRRSLAPFLLLSGAFLMLSLLFPSMRFTTIFRQGDSVQLLEQDSNARSKMHDIWKINWIN